MSRRFQGGIVAASYDGLKAPNAPTIGTASAGNQSVSLTFTAPSNVGGSNVSSYAVRVSPGGLSATGTSSPISVTGLTNDVQYTFDIAAINSYGFSPYSGTVSATPFVVYVEDVFSTWLYTGNGSTQTITNGLNVSGQGGMVWLKSRSSGSYSHQLYDTTRGATQALYSNATDAQNLSTSGLTAFTSSGFSIGTNVGINASGATQASWTFRESPKFFDVVTWTGNGANRTISHNLGVAPGCIIVKRTDTTADWQVYHRSNANTEYMVLNTIAAKATGTTRWNSTTPTATEFTVGTDTNVNASGGTYVAYLFAHDTTSDGIIQCGSYTGTGAVGNFVNLGWEPQWVLIKDTTYGDDWYIYDNMRGAALTTQSWIWANMTAAEGTSANNGPSFGATGFTAQSDARVNNAGSTYIYIAIRRGPMKTPTVGTSVFAPVYGSAGAPGYKPGFVTDASFARGVSLSDPYTSARLISGTYLRTATAAAAFSDAGYRFDYMNGWFSSGLGSSVISWNFRRAPGFFDVVCYTGTGANRTVNHNLGVAPELMIIKDRSSGNDGLVYGAYLPNAATNRLVLDGVQGALVNTDTLWNATNPTSTVFSLGTSAAVNANGQTYITYLFASCPGVSKVGTYTGNGSSQTINCGFTTGARFFLVKRTDSTDSTGNWWVWDSTRGITAPADPALTLNKSDAEVTSADATDPDNSGIIVNQEATCNINVNGATYIFLAIS